MAGALFALFGLLAVVASKPHHTGETHEYTGKPWLGLWMSTDRSENFPAFIAAVGLPDQYSDDSATYKVEHHLYKEGDHYHHHISIPSKNFQKDTEFRLGQETTATFAGESIKLKYHEDGDKLVVDVNLHNKNKHLVDTYEVKGEELIKTYKIGEVTAKKWFKKQANPQ